MFSGQLDVRHMQLLLCVAHFLIWQCCLPIILNMSLTVFFLDIWSLGVILFMLVCGRAPFYEANDSETLINIMDVRYSVSEHVSSACQRLVSIYNYLIRYMQIPLFT